MSSKSQEAVETTTQNVALDRRVVLEEGQAVVDSVINSNDPEVITAALNPLIAAWGKMTYSNSLNLLEVTEMGNNLITQIDKSQVQISKSAESVLRSGIENFEKLLQANQLSVELVGDISNRAFDLTEDAVDILAEVKTGDFADLSKSIMIFALGAIALMAYTKKG